MRELLGDDEEELGASDQSVRDRDTQRKQSNKDYVDKMLSCWRTRKTTRCQQPTRKSPIQYCLDMGTKLF